jgi:hypothetical protein
MILLVNGSGCAEVSDLNKFDVKIPNSFAKQILLQVVAFKNYYNDENTPIFTDSGGFKFFYRLYDRASGPGTKVTRMAAYGQQTRQGDQTPCEQSFFCTPG